MVWKDLESRRIGKSLGLEMISRDKDSLWCTHGACTVMEIKEYDVRAHGHDMVVLR